MIVPIEFLRQFPGPAEEIFNVINFHRLLPDNPGDELVTLSSGKQIPVLRGEESGVLNEALRLKLPAIGVTMHYTQVQSDIGGQIIDRVEIPILPSDNFDSLRARHIQTESKFMADAINRWARGRYGVSSY